MPDQEKKFDPKEAEEKLVADLRATAHDLRYNTKELSEEMASKIEGHVEVIKEMVASISQRKKS